MFLNLALAQNIQAQDLFIGQDQTYWLDVTIIKDSLFSVLSTDTKKKKLVTGQNTKSFGSHLKMILTLLKEPFISKRSRMNGPYDAIIVPGIPFDKDKGAGMIMKARVKWAHYLMSQGIAKNIIFSGSAVYTPYTESRVMALYALEMGLPAEHIHCETKAEHSTENVVYSLRLARELGFEKIAIATGPFQSAFLDKYVIDHSLPVSFIAIPLLYKGKSDLEVFSSIDPSTAFVEDFVNLKDRESRAERQQGTLGNKITD